MYTSGCATWNTALPPVARDHGFAIEHPSNGDGSIAVGNRRCLIMESHHRPGGKRSTQPDDVIICNFQEIES